MIPIASIITPATLSVLPAPVDPPPSSLVHVPNLDFRSLTFLANMPADQGNDSIYIYNGPDQAVLEIATAVAAQGAILPITPPEANASWSLSFYGPSLKCDNISDVLQQQFSSNLRAYLTDGEYCNEPYGYLAWFPRPPSGTNSSVDAVPLVNISGTLSPDPGSMSGLGNGQNMTMYLIAMPDLFQVLEMPSHTNPIACELGSSGSSTADELWAQWTAESTEIQCQLFNSTYHVDFVYTDGTQQVSVSNSQAEASNAVTTANQVIGPTADQSNSCPTLSISGAECGFDQNVLTTLSFQAIMDAFSQNLIGAISIEGGTYVDLALNVNTSIMATSLINSADLDFLENYDVSIQGIGAYSDLQTELSAFNNSEVQGLLNNYKKVNNQSLAVALEELFQNTVVSMMSSPALQPNLSSISAPSPATVTFQKIQNIYVYAAWKLWLAYGIVIALTAIAVIVGLLAMYENGATYSNDFSTIFRVAKGAEVDVMIKAEDLDGKDPLPKYLADARISLANGTRLRTTNSSRAEGHPLAASDSKEPGQYTSLIGGEQQMTMS